MHQKKQRRIVEILEAVDIRIKFNRGREVMFISHLDLMRVFDRAFRRGNIPISFSKGFNPHANMVFGLPLQVGVTSECEYLDITLAPDDDDKGDSGFTIDSLINSLNAQLPRGIRVLEAKRRENKSNIMSQITHAEYIVTLMTESFKEGTLELIKSRVEYFLNSETCLVKKTNRVGVRDVDIRPLVKSIEVYAPKTSSESYENGRFCIKMMLGAGSKGNLKPEILLSTLGLNDGSHFIATSIHRTGLYTE